MTDKKQDHKKCLPSCNCNNFRFSYQDNCLGKCPCHPYGCETKGESSMTDETFLPYLKVSHPYLYDIELKVRKIQDATGYGDVAITLSVKDNKVVNCNIGEFVDMKYRDNVRV